MTGFTHAKLNLKESKHQPYREQVHVVTRYGKRPMSPGEKVQKEPECMYQSAGYF